MRSGLDRANYLLVKEAKIIAMTCTHAALTRRNLVKLGFRSDLFLGISSINIFTVTYLVSGQIPVNFLTNIRFNKYTFN